MPEFACAQRRLSSEQDSGGHTAKNCESTATVCCSCGQWGHMAKSCPEKGKESKAREKVRENTRGKGKGETGKGWWWSQNGKGKGKGLQSVREWDDPEQWQILVKRAKSTSVKPPSRQWTAREQHKV